MIHQSNIRIRLEFQQKKLKIASSLMLMVARPGSVCHLNRQEDCVGGNNKTYKYFSLDVF